MGIYNIYNCLAAISLCLTENFDISFVQNQVENFDYKLGRMETISFPKKRCGFSFIKKILLD
ncbi:hypothetical protein [Methanobrevibacter arboriphilus]|uniref:hypothetical protein n=1 Tax=Methanobrevibacter arboriphilus TaxID=39441 RepID=UPI000B23F10C|nr:hypothetical protein [Methanobrevibacter arboriphilus]